MARSEELDAVVERLPQRWRAFVLLGAYGVTSVVGTSGPGAATTSI